MPITCNYIHLPSILFYLLKDSHIFLKSQDMMDDHPKMMIIPLEDEMNSIYKAKPKLLILCPFHMTLIIFLLYYFAFCNIPLVSRNDMLSPRNNEYSPGGWVEINCKARIKLLILCPFHIAIFIFLLFNFTH